MEENSDQAKSAKVIQTSNKDEGQKGQKRERWEDKKREAKTKRDDAVATHHNHF